MANFAPEKRARETLVRNCAQLLSAGCRLAVDKAGQGTPFSGVGVFDVETVKPFVYGNVQDIALLIYNGPNHGTYRMRAQGPNCPRYNGTTGFLEQAFQHMGQMGTRPPSSCTILVGTPRFSGWRSESQPPA